MAVGVRTGAVWTLLLSVVTAAHEVTVDNEFSDDSLSLLQLTDSETDCKTDMGLHMTYIAASTIGAHAEPKHSKTFPWQRMINKNEEDKKKNKYDLDTKVDRTRLWHCNRECVIAFSPTDNMENVKEDAEFDLDSYCNFNGVHKGFLVFLQTFPDQKERWMQGMMGLSPENCDSVTAIGHSLGGVAAHMFAACANAKISGVMYKDKFMLASVRKDVQAMTYGAPAGTLWPLYNAHHGLCLEGTRFAIESDERIEWTPENMRGTVEWLREVFKNEFSKKDIAKRNTPISTEDMEKQDRLLENILNEVSGIAKEDKLKGETLHQFQSIMPIVATRLASYFKPALATVLPMLELNNNFKKWRELTGTVFKENEWNLKYDTVPSMFGALGFVHPKMKMQELNCKTYITDDTSLLRTLHACDDEVPMLPRRNPIRSFIAVLIKSGLPNHNICCYADGTKNIKETDAKLSCPGNVEWDQTEGNGMPEPCPLTPWWEEMAP